MTAAPSLAIQTQRCVVRRKLKVSQRATKEARIATSTDAADQRPVVDNGRGNQNCTHADVMHRHNAEAHHQAANKMAAESKSGAAGNEDGESRK